MEPLPSLPNNINDLPFLAAGVSGFVFEVSDSAVVKVPSSNEESRHALEVECAIYKRLGFHPHITKLLYTQKGMLVLERLQYPLRKRLWDLRDAGQFPPARHVLRWAIQITQALHYLHSRGVFQVDIGPHNVLLDWEENVKLSDFAGSSIDGSNPTVQPSTRSEHPNIPTIPPSVQSEIFALGSMLYEVETTRKAYHDKTEMEIEELFCAGKFPDTSGLMLAEVITKCWRVEYKNVEEVTEDIKKMLDPNSTNKAQRGWWKE